MSNNIYKINKDNSSNASKLRVCAYASSLRDVQRRKYIVQRFKVFNVLNEQFVGLCRQTWDSNILYIRATLYSSQSLFSVAI